MGSDWPWFDGVMTFFSSSEPKTASGPRKQGETLQHLADGCLCFTLSVTHEMPLDVVNR